MQLIRRFSMGEASPEAGALAGLAADLGYCALFGLLILAAVDAYAPPQDLPWKPLDLDRPLGLATGAQLGRTLAQPGGCSDFITRSAVAFSPVPDRRSGFCVVEDAGQVGPQPMRLAPARPLMTCRLTAPLAIWTRHVVSPAAKEILGSDVVQIDHYGTYACRRIYGRSEGRVSQHASADAVDIAGFRLADGRRISVLEDWTSSREKGAFLRRVRDDGCRLFRTVLSPDYNDAHANHLHFDMGPYRLCR